ncbi:response regulator transcription factor [Cupriavidus sp. SW-Y-13]|uniref:response regulator transcription factor n=1 Tax=Cupriavidus sp. SW-Y-13 TaxID=2653854 RepID=UPI001365BF8C|nr:response regulator [Cupriavidus sp. SW-Y-13]MWL90486.1 response regulator [Cupriavidus sp. SW-Y-13]
MDASGQFAHCVAVVDDDASVARSTARLLRAAGIGADVYVSGDDFLHRIRDDPRYRPDCVILDVCMPGLNGLEVQQQLIGLPMSLIFITAHDVPAARDTALAAGAIGYLRKPFHAAQLIELVRGVLRTGLRP